MPFNGFFGDCDFAYEEDNSNIISLKQEDFKMNFEEGISQKFSNIKSINNNNEFTINSNTNNIFSSVPMEIEINYEYNNNNINTINTFYDTLLPKELIKYHLINIFNIIKSKIIIKYFQVFHILKELSSNKINNLIKAEILFLKISGNLGRIAKIFSKNRKNIIYQVFNLLKYKAYISKNNFKNSHDNFKNNCELKYRNEKVKAINENNNTSIKILEKDIEKIEKNIELLADKERKLNNEINTFFKKEKLLTDKIKTIENSTYSKKNQFNQVT